MLDHDRALYRFQNGVHIARLYGQYWKEESGHWMEEFFDLLDSTIKGGAFKDYKTLHSRILQAMPDYRQTGKEQITVWPIESEGGDRRFVCEIKNFGAT